MNVSEWVWEWESRRGTLASSMGITKNGYKKMKKKKNGFETETKKKLFFINKEEE